MSQDEKILVRVPQEIWGWIADKPWHNSDWEKFKDSDLPKATKCVRALLLIYKWYAAFPSYIERHNRRVIIEFETEGDAIAFCSMLASEKKKGAKVK